MNKAVLGIDLGTSSVKVMLLRQDGTREKIRATYDENSPLGWLAALEKAIGQIDKQGIEAVGLSSQVGTYITDEGHVLPWNSGGMEEELSEVLKSVSKEECMQEISMPHPAILSYPLPRLLYIKRHFKEARSVCQPKDFLLEVLTGKQVSDMYSWRGLSNLKTGTYSRRFLEKLGLDCFELPPLIDAFSEAGRTTGKILPAGIPVFTGLNDFYAGLLGMGIWTMGDMFDITGTSEHIGCIESAVRTDTDMVSSPFLSGAVHYGVTASGGASLSFGRTLSEHVDMERSLQKEAPVFLPYLCGERAPIWDSRARGAFYGINEKTDKADLAYAALEGVAFSLFHIYEHMGKPTAKVVKVAGGAAENPVLNRLKAEILGMDVICLVEKDTSALGACMVAAVGRKWYKDLPASIQALCRETTRIVPSGKYRGVLEKRFAVYKQLYPALQSIKKEE